MSKLVFVNQYSTQLFLEKLEAFEQEGYDTILFTGKSNISISKSAQRKIITSFSYNRKNMVTRMFTWFTFSLHFFLYALTKAKNKTFVITTNPAILPWFIFLLNKLKSLRYYLIVYDVYPEVLVSMKYLSQDHIIVRLWNRVNNKVYEKSRGIFTISQAMAQLLKAKTTTPVKLVHNWFDKSFEGYKDKDSNWFVKQHGLSGKRVILYSGNLGITHKVESLVELASKFKNDQEYVFLIIGEGTKKKNIQEEVEKRGLDNVIILPLQPFKELTYTLSSADFGVVALDESAQSVSVPSKTYYLMAAGCALLCLGGRKSELGRLVENYKLGVIFGSGEIDEMEKFLRQLSVDDLLELKKNSIEASRHFSSDNAKLYVNFVQENGL